MKERLLKRCCRLSASNNTEHEPAAIFDRDQDEKQDTAVVRVSGESVRVIIFCASVICARIAQRTTLLSRTVWHGLSAVCPAHYAGELGFVTAHAMSASLPIACVQCVRRV
jgi:hypothetical protein